LPRGTAIIATNLSRLGRELALDVWAEKRPGKPSPPAPSTRRFRGVEHSFVVYAYRACLLGFDARPELRESPASLRDRSGHLAGRLFDHRRLDLQTLATAHDQNLLVIVDVTLLQQSATAEEP